MFSDDEAEPAGQTVDLDLDGAARRRTAAGLEVEPTPPVLVRVLGAVLFFLGRAYTFLRYTVFLYSLPPFVPESKVGKMAGTRPQPNTPRGACVSPTRAGCSTPHPRPAAVAPPRVSRMWRRASWLTTGARMADSCRTG